MKSTLDRIKERNRNFTPAQLEEKRKQALKRCRETKRRERNK